MSFQFGGGDGSTAEEQIKGKYVSIFYVKYVEEWIKVTFLLNILLIFYFRQP
jgi:hypothetical protein